jgi:hypothetical protein
MKSIAQRGNLQAPSFQEGGGDWEESEPAQILVAPKRKQRREARSERGG